MTAKQTLQPILRFPEFEGDWEIKKFGDIISVKSAKYNPLKEQISQKCIELEHIEQESGRLIGFSEALNLASIKNKFNKGDVLFGKLRPYLRKYILAPFDGVCTSEIWVLTSDKIEQAFLYRIVENDRFIEIANRSTGSKMPRADWNVISDAFFNFPSVQEQTKIANFLSSIDEKINLLKEKKALLEAYKKGMMQKIFNQEIRFKDDNGNDFEDWEEKSLGEVCEITMGQSPDSKSYNMFGLGKLLVQGNADILNRKSNPRNWTSEPTKECKIGDLILTVRAPVGAIAKSIHNACIGRGVCSIRNNAKSHIEYLYQFLLDYELKWKRLEQGSTFTAVNGADIKSIEINLPSLLEQTKIANFLSAIDEKIDLITIQIQDTQEYKKGLLQQMFI